MKRIQPLTPLLLMVSSPYGATASRVPELQEITVHLTSRRVRVPRHR
jgi:hypothetical protein